MFVIKWSVRPRVITFVVFYKFVVCVLRLHRVAEERSLESCFHIGDLMTLRTLAPCEIRLSEVRLTSWKAPTRTRAVHTPCTRTSQNHARLSEANLRWKIVTVELVEWFVYCVSRRKHLHILVSGVSSTQKWGLFWSQHKFGLGAKTRGVCKEQFYCS